MKEFTQTELDEIRKERNRSLREWRRKNPDLVRQANQRYYLNRSRRRAEQNAQTAEFGT